MKFKAISIIFISLSSYLLAQNITVSNNWQLLGAIEDINTAVFDKSGCVDFVWKYKDGSWQVHIANGNKYNIPSDISLFTTIKKGEGFWIIGNKNCEINTNQNQENTNYENKDENSNIVIYHPDVSQIQKVEFDKNAKELKIYFKEPMSWGKNPTTTGAYYPDSEDFVSDTLFVIKFKNYTPGGLINFSKDYFVSLKDNSYTKAFSITFPK